MSTSFVCDWRRRAAAPLPPRMRLTVVTLSVFGSLGPEVHSLLSVVTRRFGRRIPTTLLPEVSWTAPSLAPLVRSALGFAARRGLAESVTAFYRRAPVPPAAAAPAPAPAVPPPPLWPPAPLPLLAPPPALPALPVPAPAPPVPILAPGEDLDADSDDELGGMGQGVGAMDFTETDLAGAEAGDAAPPAPGAQGAVGFAH